MGAMASEIGSRINRSRIDAAACVRKGKCWKEGYFIERSGERGNNAPLVLHLWNTGN
jgi:hypothetical protein